VTRRLGCDATLLHERALTVFFSSSKTLEGISEIRWGDSGEVFAR
jgi:hypothetical protein